MGGNYGWFTLLGASLGCHVETFEPVPANVALIQANLRSNPQLAARGATVQIHPHVVYPTAGVYTLSVPIPRLKVPHPTHSVPS